MADADKTKTQLLAELAAARQRIAELEAAETEHQRTEQILRENEAKYRLLVENPLTGVYIIDDKDTFVYVNDETARILGYTAEELIGTDFHRIIGSASQAIVATYRERRSRGETSLARFEIELVRKDGEARMVENAGFSIVDGNGNWQAIGKVLDITERKQAEQALRESQEKLQALMDASPVAVSWSDEAENIQYCNRKFTELFGYSLEEVPTVAQWYERAYPDPAYRKTVMACWNAAVAAVEESAETEIAPMETVVTCKNGTLRHVAVAGAIILNRVLVISSDLTAYKQAERAIADWKHRYEFVAAAAGQIVYDHNFADSTITWGGSVEPVLGYQLTEMDGGFPQWEELMNPADREETLRLLEAAEKNGTPFEAEYGYRHKDGHYVRMLDRGFIMPNPGGQPEQLVGVMQDITERQQAERQRFELALERERSETFRTLVTNIAHDLKTPLSTINTNLYLLERLTDPEKRQQRMEAIAGQTRTLANFVQDLTVIARLEGEPELRLASLDLNALITSLEAEFRPLIEQKRIAFTLDLDANLPPIQVDQPTIRRMLTNLIENAINYTPAGGSITVQTRQQFPDIVLEVIDTGIGISETDLPNIFERFYRSEQARVAVSTGSGLGLAIVKRVVEMHGGGIQVESQPGEGTVFRVLLPTQ